MRLTLVRGVRQICWAHISFLILFILYAICIWKTGRHFFNFTKICTSSVNRNGILFDVIKWIHFKHIKFASLTLVFLSLRETTSSSVAHLLTLAVRAVNGQAVIFDSGERRMGQTNLNDVSQDFSQFYPRLREIQGSSPVPSPTQIKCL